MDEEKQNNWREKKNKHKNELNSIKRGWIFCCLAPKERRKNQTDQDTEKQKYTKK